MRGNFDQHYFQPFNTSTGVIDL